MNSFIDDLQRKLRDAQFQSDRLLKREPLDQHFLVQLADLSSNIKSDLTSLETSSAFSQFITDLAILDPDFTPTLSTFRKVAGFLTVGWSIKKYIVKAKRDYTIKTVKQLKEHYAYLERHLSDL